MTIKNANVHVLTGSIPAAQGALEEGASKFAHRQIKAQEAERSGFVPVIDDSFTARLGGALWFKVRIQQRVIPPAAITELLDENIAAIEKVEGRKVFRKEKAAIKDEIIFDMLPKAPIVSKYVRGYLSDSGLLVVDSPSDTIVGHVLALIREASGGLAALRPTCRTNHELVLSRIFLNPEEGESLNIVDNVTLQAEYEKAVGSGDVIFSDGFRDLCGCMNVVQATVEIGTKTRFILKSPYHYNKIQIPDYQIDELEFSDDEEYAEAEALLCTQNIHDIFEAVGTQFGGWEHQEEMDLPGE